MPTTAHPTSKGFAMSLKMLMPSLDHDLVVVEWVYHPPLTCRSAFPSPSNRTSTKGLRSPLKLARDEDGLRQPRNGTPPLVKTFVIFREFLWARGADGTEIGRKARQSQWREASWQRGIDAFAMRRGRQGCGRFLGPTYRRPWIEWPSPKNAAFQVQAFHDGGK
ncbi:uncharacterized protein FOMMEDRAFT_157817 [Fomitiporia mediterranea MF3/22]|uniref:uncharacterized protein n=1 Tax=Fomitiporia mediterranea (strain MF3/22) TaxID=694068 RepID=UPI0004407E66|nr:uncharacterized protein FOMMEDRAFT_157817 [Fomitiporia mediterranea MF3/22]EJD00717.1 hypothetical protein FOMMEDRAFT_157817 [Fomitiporia mediterranea MF3/22]